MATYYGTRSQAIGANAALLPRPMQVKFTSLFDDAPQIPYSVVHKVFVSELGRPPSGPDGVFEIFEENAIASASISQVHKAKLWPKIGPDGKPEKEERWVAVKVQKPDVSKQMEWDLGAYRMVMWVFEHWAFDLPVYFVVGKSFAIFTSLVVPNSQTDGRFHLRSSSTRARFCQRG